VLTVGIVDANEVVSSEYAGLTGSVVGGWLQWELARANITLVEPGCADVVLLVFSGALDFLRASRRALRRCGIEPDAGRRDSPYIITGGPCDAIPFTVLQIANALAIGEAYKFIRELAALLACNCTISDISAMVTAYPHAIEREQLSGLTRDTHRPWLLTEPAPVLATPDDYIDWTTPPVRSTDNVVRVVASKGCHKKCAFCATTYRQAYATDDNGQRVIARVESLKRRGERVQLLSNDPLNLPYFRDINTRLDSQSFTIDEIADDENRAAVIRAKPGMARFGVEGLSERLRRAFGKAITCDKLLHVVEDLHSQKVNTHLFYIVGAPYEGEEDWDEFRETVRALSLRVTVGICRVKMTTFLPTPPAPLARFIPAAGYADQMRGFKVWLSRNCASRHLLFVYGRGAETRTDNIAEQLSVPRDIAKTMASSDVTLDLAPTEDDQRRLPWEVVGWPLDMKRRNTVADVYKRRIADRL